MKFEYKMVRFHPSLSLPLLLVPYSVNFGPLAPHPSTCSFFLIKNRNIIAVFDLVVIILNRIC